ncbi:MAG: gliding motility protein GldN [Tannerella sp.]|jgi:gliding motility associated protien GldN|nr:gliding motility protein GldN [Tannerella sp.]
MKGILYIGLLAGLASLALPAGAQSNQTKRRSPVMTMGEQHPTTQNGANANGLSVRAQELNARMTQTIPANTRWMRVLYRRLDLKKEANAPLYYPPRPMGGSENLFSTLFRLFLEGKIKVYQYVDGYEPFDEAHLLKLKDFLDGAHIYYEVKTGKNKADTTYVVNDSDIPSADVLSYYVKEAWYFNQNNSLFDVKTLAICPLVTQAGDLSATETTPLFWVPYESIRPYLAEMHIMTSDVNNAKTLSMDDYFRNRMFKGDIIKTENLMNKTMQQLYPNTDSLHLAQQAIEKQLATFHAALYVQPDSTQLVSKKGAKVKKASKQRGASTAKAPKEEKTKQPKAPKVKVQRESSAPRHSVRRR